MLRADRQGRARRRRRRGRLRVRAQVGRVPLHRVPRRRRRRARQPQRATADPLLPGGGRGGQGRAAAAVRRRRRDRGGGRRPPGVRAAARPHPPGRLTGPDARREDAGVVRRLRPAGLRRPRPDRAAVRRAPPAAGGGAVGRDGPRAPDRADPLGATTAQRVAGRRSRGPGSTASSPSRCRRRTRPGQRTMLKIKHERTADVVVAGYRLHKTSTPEQPLLGSMLLGLLRRRGHAAARRGVRRRSRRPPGRAGRGAARRWRTDAGRPPVALGRRGGRRRGRPPAPGQHRRAGTPARTCRSSPLRPERVLEVAYDHMQGTRFRHTTQFRRWRPDRDAAVVHATPSWRRSVSYDLAEPVRTLTRLAPAAGQAYASCRGRRSGRRPRAYDVVLLVERELTDLDAEQVVGLHEDLERAGALPGAAAGRGRRRPGAGRARARSPATR